MIRKFIPFSLAVAIALLLLPGCVKRLPAAAGGDKKVVAGHEMTFGSAEKVPEGGSVVWSMGDGSRYTGAQVRHAWHRPGKFQVVVTVTDPDGQKRTDSSTVEVSRPPLLDVIPASAGFVLLMSTPGEKLKDVPVLMEHMFSSSDEVNSTLAQIRETLGFDPFSSSGWREAGIDPTGGIALAGLDEGRDMVLVAGLLPGGNSKQTLRHLFMRKEQMTESPAANNSSISAVIKKGSKEAEYAYMDFRGHVWVAFQDKDDSPKPKAPRKGPVQVLAELRSAGLQNGLADNEDWFVPAMASSKKHGAVELFLSKEFMRTAEEEETSSPEERAKDEAIVKKIKFLRMDLDLLPKAVNADLRLGFEGNEANKIADVFHARNAVPAFRATMAKGQHMVLKLSMNLPGLIAAMADLGGERKEWDSVLASLEQYKATAGVDAKGDILDNIGDSMMVAIRWNLGGIFGLLGQGKKDQTLGDYLDGTMLLQLRDAKRFFKAIDSLSRTKGANSGIQRMTNAGAGMWSIGPKTLGLVLLQTDSMAIVGTSEAAAKASAARLSLPHDPDARWPETIEDPEQQVWGMDLLQLRKDLESFQPSGQNASTSLIKNMIMMTLAGVGQLNMLVTTATFDKNILQISGCLNMK